MQARQQACTPPARGATTGSSHQPCLTALFSVLQDLGYSYDGAKNLLDQNLRASPNYHTLPGARAPPNHAFPSLGLLSSLVEAKHRDSSLRWLGCESYVTQRLLATPTINHTTNSISSTVCSNLWHVRSGRTPRLRSSNTTEAPAVMARRSLKSRKRISGSFEKTTPPSC
jgi:hypothetical protein